MRREVIKRIGDFEIRIWELTVADIRSWLKDWIESGDQDDAVDSDLFVGEFTLPDLYRQSSLDREQAERLTPSQLREINAWCREVNADFFRFARERRMMARANAIQRALGANASLISSLSLSDPASSSSSEGTPESLTTPGESSSAL